MIRNLTTALKLLTLLVILLVASLIALPRLNFTINENTINSGFVDEFLQERNLFISDFKKGEGLYPTNLVRVDLPAEISRELRDSIVNIIKLRINLSLLGDVNFEAKSDASGDYLTFEYPNYYTDPILFTQWLTATGDISFTTFGEAQELLDLSDYNIEGELKPEFNALYGDHLSFYFSSDKVAIIDSLFKSQNRLFIMNIDNASAFYVLDYDQFIDTNLGRVRAVSLLTLSGRDENTVRSYLNIVKSYFAAERLPTRLIVSDVIQELAPSSKPLTLSLITLGSLIVLLFTTVFITFLNREVGLKAYFRNIIIALIFSILFIALLKIASGILNTNLILTFLFTTIISLTLLLQKGDNKQTRSIILILGLFSIGISRLSNLNFALGSVGAVALMGFVSAYFTLSYSEVLNKLDLPKLKIKKLKFK